MKPASDAAGSPVLEEQDGRILRAKLRRTATRRALVDAARGLFASQGYEATTLAEIATAAGVSRATYYQHFDNKPDAFAAVVETLLQQLDAVVVGVELAAGSAPPQQQVIDNFMRVFDVLLSRPEYAQLLLVEAVGKHDVLGGRAEAFFAAMLELIRSGLEQGQEAGLVRSASVDIAGWAVLGAIKEVLRRALTSGRDHMDVDERRAIAEELLRCCFAGVGSRVVRDSIVAEI